MQINVCESAHRTPAFAIIAEGWNELVQTGQTPDGVASCPVQRDDAVVYAQLDNGEIVGVLVLSSGPAEDFMRLVLAYVEPSMRRKAVFRSLLAEALTVAKKRGADRLVIESMAGSDALQVVMRKIGVPVARVIHEVAV